ncbi:hypothetical protein STSP2_03130 [Anaerohalosphaera lusitana]|uniref:Uncharacterized protein n=1 Tax=Anaerohalosphaera lusitana TaxID=1936003 RepID=A0A1U9NQN4_9BACT|nr:hypothetical protein STSP2_03130 [Anaerohalosphaera lusitana]
MDELVIIVAALLTVLNLCILFLDKKNEDEGQKRKEG